MIVRSPALSKIGFQDKAVLRRIFLSRREARDHFHPLSVASPQLQWARFELITVLDKDDVPISKGLYGLRGDGNLCGDFFLRQLYGHEESGPPKPLWIRYIDMGRSGPALLADQGADKGNPSGRLHSKFLRSHRNRLPQLDRAQVLGVDRDVPPNGREIRNDEDVGVFFDRLSDRNPLFNNNPILGGSQFVTCERPLAKWSPYLMLDHFPFRLGCKQGEVSARKSQRQQ